MKVYSVIDDSEIVIVTTDRLKMLEALMTLYKKYADKQSFFWVDEEELK